MFFLLLVSSNNAFVCFFMFFKIILSSRPRRKRTCVGFFFALSVFIINKKKESFWSRLCFILCLFRKNGNTKKQKILQSFSNICIIITCQNQKSNHALMNPLNTLTMYSLPTLSPLYPKAEEENEETPNKISHILGHSLSRRLSRRWLSLSKTGMRWYHYLTWVLCFSTHFNRGNPLFH